MSFREYVDKLAKQGFIDGNIAEHLTAFHNAEVSSPVKPVRDKLHPILCEVWNSCNGDRESDKALVELVDKIDDALGEIGSEYRAKGGVK